MHIRCRLESTQEAVPYLINALKPCPWDSFPRGMSRLQSGAKNCITRSMSRALKAAASPCNAARMSACIFVGIFWFSIGVPPPGQGNHHHPKMATDCPNVAGGTCAFSWTGNCLRNVPPRQRVLIPRCASPRRSVQSPDARLESMMLALLTARTSLGTATDAFAPYSLMLCWQAGLDAGAR